MAAVREEIREMVIDERKKEETSEEIIQRRMQELQEQFWNKKLNVEELNKIKGFLDETFELENKRKRPSETPVTTEDVIKDLKSILLDKYEITNTVFLSGVLVYLYGIVEL